MIVFRKSISSDPMTSATYRHIALFSTVGFEASTCLGNKFSDGEIEVKRIVKIINNHPLTGIPLETALLKQIQPCGLSTSLVENVLGRLFAAHSNGVKAFEFFKFSLNHTQCFPSSDAVEKTLHILTRMRYFDKAWELLEEIRKKHPSLLSHKSMSIILSKIAKFQSFEETLKAFERMEKDIFVGRKFDVDEFNVLLRAFCTQRQMKEAKSVFQKMHNRFSPNTKTMNILLLGFKESGDITAVELFYHEMVRRGFKPNSITYNIRIDAYCKKGCFSDGLRLLEEMDKIKCSPTLQTMTTLIHGAGVAQNPSKARKLFDELKIRNIQPDVGAYNALMSSLIRSRDVKSAVELMDQMENKRIGHNSVTYHTMFLGLLKSDGIGGVCELYHRMIRKAFVPKTRTVVMLMKLFCENQCLDLGLNLWEHLIKQGYCPHSHALDLLVTGLCAHRRVEEAFEVSKQILLKGRHMSEPVSLMLDRILLEEGETGKLNELKEMMKRLEAFLPPRTGHVRVISPAT